MYPSSANENSGTKFSAHSNCGIPRQTKMMYGLGMGTCSRDHSAHLQKWDLCVLDSVKRRNFFKEFFSYHFSFLLNLIITDVFLLNCVWRSLGVVRSPMEELLKLCLYCTTVLTSIDHVYLNWCFYMSSASRKKVFEIYIAWKAKLLDKGEFILLITVVNILPLTVYIRGKGFIIFLWFQK